METVNRISKKGLTESLALTRWIQPYSDEEHFFIESNSIIIMTPASVGMSRYYEYVVKSYDGLVLKEAKEERVELEFSSQSVGDSVQVQVKIPLGCLTCQTTYHIKVR